VPTLLSWTGSAVIHDIKGENWTLTAGWRSGFSHCLRLDPTDASSARYNPLLEVRRGAREVADAQNIADILVDPEGALERRNHWEQASHALLVGAILHVLYVGQDKTLAGVARLLSDPERPISATLQAMLTADHMGADGAPRTHPVVAAAARDLLNKSEAERSGVVSTAIGFLGLYRDPVIAMVTADSDWRIADLLDATAPVTLYLVVPPSDLSRTRPLVRLILNQIGRRLTEHLPRQPHPDRQLLLMLDEFPALGRLDFFESALAFLAGYGVRAILVAQSLNQVAKAYGENSSIVDNCRIRIAFATNDERTAKRISDALGTSTERRRMRSYGGNRWAAWLPHVTEARQETARPLLTPGEIMQLPGDEALVLVSGAAPIRARKLRYHEDGHFRARLLPPPHCDRNRQDRPATRHHDWANLETVGSPATSSRRTPASSGPIFLGLEDIGTATLPPDPPAGALSSAIGGAKGDLAEQSNDAR
jgi:type IV secretion system protein VirD4